jgi:lipopolysaccharide transport system permease protein
MMIYFGIKGADFHITWAIALFPVLILLMALLGLGLGLIITAMTESFYIPHRYPLYYRYIIYLYVF